MFKTPGILALTAFLIAGCKKEVTPAIPAVPVKPDNVAPVITLKGNKIDTVVLNVVYVDAGATATDDKDGNLDAAIVTSGFFNRNNTGTYILTYTVKDAAGNLAAVTRTVHVKNNLDYLEGVYMVDCHCNTEGTVSTTYSSSVVVSSIEDYAFSVSDLDGLDWPAAPYGIQVSPVMLQNNTFVMGKNYNDFNKVTGTLAADRLTFTLQTSTRTGYSPNDIKKCTSVFTKQ